MIIQFSIATLKNSLFKGVIRLVSWYLTCPLRSLNSLWVCAGTGKGGESIFGKYFEDELNDTKQHTQRGMLSMASRGPNTNGYLRCIDLSLLCWFKMIFIIIIFHSKEANSFSYTSRNLTWTTWTPYSAGHHIFLLFVGCCLLISFPTQYQSYLGSGGSGCIWKSSRRQVRISKTIDFLRLFFVLLVAVLSLSQ